MAGNRKIRPCTLGREPAYLARDDCTGTCYYYLANGITIALPIGLLFLRTASGAAPLQASSMMQLVLFPQRVGIGWYGEIPYDAKRLFVRQSHRSGCAGAQSPCRSEPVGSMNYWQYRHPYEGFFANEWQWVRFNSGNGRTVSLNYWQ